MTHQKRLSAPEHYDIERKNQTYTTTTEGSRSPEQGIPAVIFLREVTGFAETKKEAKEIIRSGTLYRNNDRIKDVRDTIGIMDLVEIKETGQKYRVIPSEDRLEFQETEDNRVAAKITGKKVDGEEFVYHLHSGENIRTSEDFDTGSTVLEEDGDIETFPLEESSQVIILGGKHAGKKAEIEEMHQRGMRPDTATVDTGENSFEIRQEKIFARGDLEV
jgi:small subunit ribosomal protein S4e